MPGLPLLWRSSLRLRLTVAGVSLAAAIFAIGGAVTISLYSRSLTLSEQHYTAVAGEASPGPGAEFVIQLPLHVMRNGTGELPKGPPVPCAALTAVSRDSPGR